MKKFIAMALVAAVMVVGTAGSAAAGARCKGDSPNGTCHKAGK